MRSWRQPRTKPTTSVAKTELSSWRRRSWTKLVRRINSYRSKKEKPNQSVTQVIIIGLEQRRGRQIARMINSRRVGVASNRTSSDSRIVKDRLSRHHSPPRSANATIKHLARPVGGPRIRFLRKRSRWNSSLNAAIAELYQLSR